MGFVFFPGPPRTAQEVFRELDIMKENVYYALMVDRIAPNGDIDAPPNADLGKSIFEQFPLNCAITLLLQNSDPRKACAYRGYLRTTSGNHNVIGLNETAQTLVQKDPSEHDRLLQVLEAGFGDRVYKILPKPLKPVLPIPHFASAYHFKWIRGLAAKLERRAQTEVYTDGQYGDMRTLLDKGHKLNQNAIKRLCGCRGCASSEPRGLSARELTMIFLNIQDEYLEQVAIDRC